MRWTGREEHKTRRCGGGGGVAKARKNDRVGVVSKVEVQKNDAQVQDLIRNSLEVQ